MRGAVAACALGCAMAAMDAIDVSGDGGVLKTIRRAGDGAAPRRGQVARLKYTAALADGTPFDDVAEQALVCGADGNVRALDVGAASMQVGEACRLEAQFAYAYGEQGRPGRVPPRATVVFEVELLGVADAAAAASEPLALPAEAAHPDAGGATTVSVDGQPVSLDALGPMVVNKDGTLSRITNWDEMTEAEKEKTLRIIAKRNQKRLAALKADL
mmetsp:Transcript_33486/g.103735  ORF Transcript_33486/g.103735 Transcript_33486/m.103735 type:complete len:215 (-) Transcript_33486:6-650(-)